MFNVFRKPRMGRRRVIDIGYSGGFPVEPIVTELQFTASVQPAPSEALNLLPEGRRTTGAVVVYTDTELKMASREFNSDLMLHNGLVYECMAKMEWGNNIINYNSYVFQVVPDLTELPTVTP